MRIQTLADAQSATGVDASNLSRYETGNAAPDIATLGRLLDGYGATLAELAEELAAVQAGEPSARNGNRAERLARATALLLDEAERAALQEVVRPIVAEELDRRLREK